jgi:hypothetical protein
MAGGTYAVTVPCLKCAGPALRTAEGQENDYYTCAHCGLSFGIDWMAGGPPLTPCWPISEEDAQDRRRKAGENHVIQGQRG